MSLISSLTKRDAAAWGQQVADGVVRQPAPGRRCADAPGKIICLGGKHADHARDGGNTVADDPALRIAPVDAAAPVSSAIDSNRNLAERRQVRMQAQVNASAVEGPRHDVPRVR